MDTTIVPSNPQALGSSTRASTRSTRPPGATTLALTASLALAACAAVSSAQTWNTVTAPIGAILQSQPSIPGASLLVMQGDRVLYERSWGAYDQTTQLRIASASKLLAAIAIMSLVDDGLLDLDAPISTYLPDEFPPATPKGAITVRQAFSHTSGLPGQSQFVNNRSITLAESVALIGANTPLTSTPGAVFSYGGVSMHVAGRVAEVLTGKPWKQLFDERVCTPLGLLDTDWDGLGITDNPRIAGGARSSVRDYTRVLRMLSNDGVIDGSTVLSPSSVDTILADQANTDATAFLPEGLSQYLGYGIGAWIELQDQQTAEPLEFTSPGAFGTTPWINPAQRLHGIFVIDASLGAVDQTLDNIRAFARNIQAGNPCPADLTADGTVDSNDLSVLLGAFATNPNTNPHTDLNNDGTTNSTDLGLLLGVWGGACG